MAYFYKDTKKTVITITNLFRVPLPYHVPVDDLPEGFEVGGAAVLVVQVVGMFPHVEGEEGLEAVSYRIVCIGALEDNQFTILLGGEPHPSAAEEAHALGFKIGLEGFEGAPLLLDLGKEWRFFAALRITGAALEMTGAEAATISSKDLPSYSVPPISLFRLSTYV